MIFNGTKLALYPPMTTLDTLWYSRSLHPSPLGLAAQLGWYLDEFRDDGTQVFTIQDSLDTAVLDAHLDHSRPHTLRQGGNVPAIWARSRQTQTRVIGLTWLEEFQGILSLPISDIAVPSDLRGKRLALPVYDARIESRRAEALQGYLVTLATAGLGAADVEMVDITADKHWSTNTSSAKHAGLFGEYAYQIGALLRREVDAVYVKGARGLQCARSASAHIVFDIRNHPDSTARVHTGAPRPITVDAGLLKNHPDVVERFLARVLAVGDWASRHPGETAAYLSRETRSSTDLVYQAYGTDVHLKMTTDLSARSVQALDMHKRFLLEWGFIAHDFDTHAWIDPAPLAAAQERLDSLLLQAP